MKNIRILSKTIIRADTNKKRVGDEVVQLPFISPQLPRRLCSFIPLFLNVFVL